MPDKDNLPLDDLDKGGDHRHSEEQGDEGQMEEWLMEDKPGHQHIPPQSKDDLQAIADHLEDHLDEVLTWARAKKDKRILDLVEQATRNLGELDAKKRTQLHAILMQFEQESREQGLAR